ncbi:MAG: transposase [Candidatus Caldatribacteriota bacterium]|nr:transposase [Candidatus Caldatribacteriota bacterium]
MPRIARIVGIGYPHHVIHRGNNRQNIFFDQEDRRLYLKWLEKYSLECNCTVHAYCLMSNHVHLLVIPQYNYSLAKTMQKLSLRFTQHINKKYKRTGRLWECRFYSTLADKESYFWSIARYIERNPIRAKVVNKPDEYKWSSAKANITGKGIGFIKPIWQDDKQRKEYITFLNKPDREEEIEIIKKSTICGKPIGSEKFLNHLVETLGITINTRPRGRPRKEKN